MTKISNEEKNNNVNMLLGAVNPPTYDCNGRAIGVKIQPQNIIAWYAWDWNKWCKNGSRDVVEGDVISWAYCT